MKRFSAILPVLFGTLILSMIGLYNGYPLVYSDTGTYIGSGLQEFVPTDRPVSYGLFIKLFSFNVSLWYVILFQNLIVAYILFELLKSFKICGKYFNFTYLSIVAFLVLFTGIGWYSNQVMPDFFAPLVVITIYLIFSDENKFLLRTSLLYLVLIFSLVTHFSHLLIGLLMILIVMCLKLISRKFLKDIQLKKIGIVSLLLLFSWLLIPSFNYIIEKRFILSKGNHVFLVAHLNDTGILEKFLDDKCDEEEYRDCKLCRYKDELPADLASFIWSGHILDSTGGWEGSRQEYNKIIAGTLKDPGYLFLNIKKSVNYGLIQLTRNKIGQGLSAYNEGSPPYGQIHWEFHHELNNYLNSKQNQLKGATLKLDTLNTVHLFVMIISIFMILAIFSTNLYKTANRDSMRFLWFVLAGVIINSFITAGLNSPCDRFQARIVWLVPLSLIIFIMKNYSQISGMISHK